MTFPENVLLPCLTDGRKKIIQSETVHDMRRADAQERDDIVGRAAVAVHALPREQRGRRRHRAGKLFVFNWLLRFRGGAVFLDSFRDWRNGIEVFDGAAA
ncbi:hypothetical protein [Bifidobacterium mongoliense]|uniref:hypothetical protein n=1 Tax=Bifidobacterium mongoliense TaxID=518643 RepID=UPI00389A08FE